MAKRRWQDWANLVLGLWLFISPRVLGYSAETAAAWNAYVIGAGIVVFAFIAARMPKAWEEIINMVLGVWLVLSPFVLGYSAVTEIALHLLAAVGGWLPQKLRADRAVLASLPRLRRERSRKGAEPHHDRDQATICPHP